MADKSNDDSTSGEKPPLSPQSSLSPTAQSFTSTRDSSAGNRDSPAAAAAAAAQPNQSGARAGTLKIANLPLPTNEQQVTSRPHSPRRRRDDGLTSPTVEDEPASFSSPIAPRPEPQPPKTERGRVDEDSEATIRRLKDEGSKRDEEYYEQTRQAQDLAEQMENERNEEREARRKAQKERDESNAENKRLEKELETAISERADALDANVNASGEEWNLRDREKEWKEQLDNALSDVKDLEDRLETAEGNLAWAIYEKDEFAKMRDQKIDEYDRVMAHLDANPAQEQMEKVMDTFYDVFGELSEGVNLDAYINHLRASVDEGSFERKTSQVSLSGLGELHEGGESSRGNRQVSGASVGMELEGEELLSSGEEGAGEGEDEEDEEAEEDEDEDLEGVDGAEGDQDQEPEGDIEDGTAAQDLTLTSAQYQDASVETAALPLRPRVAASTQTTEVIPEPGDMATIKYLNRKVFEWKATADQRGTDRTNLGNAVQQNHIEMKELKERIGSLDKENGELRARGPSRADQERIQMLERAHFEQAQHLQAARAAAQIAPFSFSSIDSQSTAPNPAAQPEAEAPESLGFSGIIGQSTSPVAAPAAPLPEPRAPENLDFSGILSQTTRPIRALRAPLSRLTTVRVGRDTQFLLRYREPENPLHLWELTPMWIKVLIYCILASFLWLWVQFYLDRAEWLSQNDMMHQKLVLMTSGQHGRGWDWRAMLMAWIGGDPSLLG